MFTSFLSWQESSFNFHKIIHQSPTHIHAFFLFSCEYSVFLIQFFLYRLLLLSSFGISCPLFFQAACISIFFSFCSDSFSSSFPISIYLLHKPSLVQVLLFGIRKTMCLWHMQIRWLSKQECECLMCVHRHSCLCFSLYVLTLNPLKCIVLIYCIDYFENSGDYFHLNW